MLGPLPPICCGGHHLFATWIGTRSAPAAFRAVLQGGDSNTARGEEKYDCNDLRRESVYSEDLAESAGSPVRGAEVTLWNRTGGHGFPHTICEGFPRLGGSEPSRSNPQGCRTSRSDDIAPARQHEGRKMQGREAGRWLLGICCGERGYDDLKRRLCARCIVLSRDQRRPGWSGTEDRSRRSAITIF